MIGSESFWNDSSSVPVLLSPFVVVDAPCLDHRTAAVESLLLSLSTLVNLVAVETLPPEFGFLGLFHASELSGRLIRVVMGSVLSVGVSDAIPKI